MRWSIFGLMVVVALACTEDADEADKTVDVDAAGNLDGTTAGDGHADDVRRPGDARPDVLPSPCPGEAPCDVGPTPDCGIKFDLGDPDIGGLPPDGGASMIDLGLDLGVDGGFVPGGDRCPPGVPHPETGREGRPALLDCPPELEGVSCSYAQNPWCDIDDLYDTYGCRDGPWEGIDFGCCDPLCPWDAGVPDGG